MSSDYFFRTPFESSPDRELEEKQIQEIADITVKLLEKRYQAPKPVLRGVHPKSHGCVDATFEVLPDLDRGMRIGLFRQPKTYEAVIRYSNASALVTPDMPNGKDGKPENGSRGMALKVYVDEGEFLLEDNGRGSQDFLLINTPSFAFAGVADYLKLNQILLKFNDVPDFFFAPLVAAKTNPPTTPEAKAEFARVLQSFKIISQIKATPCANPLEIPYFSGAPYLFGRNRCMHFSVVPQGALKPQTPPENPSENYLREALQKTMAGSEDLVFDFKVQVRRVGDKDLFIEDATRTWDTKQFPPVTVARLTIPAPQTGLDTPEHLEECEELVYTPWHSLAEHQPLGSINRLRHDIYVASSEHRLAK